MTTPSRYQRVKDNDTRLALKEIADAIAGINTFPSGGIVLYLGAACPTGWTEIDAASGKFLKITTTAANDAGTTGGSASQSLSGTNTGTENNDASYWLATSNPGGYTYVSLPTVNHKHPEQGTITIDPPWYKVVLCQKN